MASQTLDLSSLNLSKETEAPPIGRAEKDPVSKCSEMLVAPAFGSLNYRANLNCRQWESTNVSNTSTQRIFRLPVAYVMINTSRRKRND